MEKARRGRRAVLPKTSPPVCIPRREGSHKYETCHWGAQPHTDTPTFYLHPKHLSLKTSRANTQETQRAVGNWDSTLTGLGTDLLTLCPVQKQQVESAETLREGDSLTNLKVSAREAGVCWNSLWRQRVCVVNTALSLSLATPAFSALVLSRTHPAKPGTGVRPNPVHPQGPAKAGGYDMHCPQRDTW